MHRIIVLVLPTTLLGLLLVSLFLSLAGVDRGNELPDNPIVDYTYCNCSDPYGSAAARIYMAELVYNATNNCRHLSCAENITWTPPPLVPIKGGSTSVPG
jgi:hypothetical protein